MKRDYYAILGIEKSASLDLIKKAYRKLVLQHHPDKIKDKTKQEEGKKKFQEIQEAYDVLSDEKKRAVYDQFGHENYQRHQQGGSGFESSGFDFGDIFGDIFSQFTNQGQDSYGSYKQRGEDLKYSIEINLEEAFKGTNLKIKLPRLIKCSVCEGSGKALDSKPMHCSTCKGRGKIFIQQMFLNIQQTCHVCGGRGVVQAKCNGCNGNCRINEKSLIDIEIPAGVTDGMTLRMSNNGNAGVEGGGNGDLFILVKVRKHELFEVESVGRVNNIVCIIPIDPTSAVLGDAIQVPTIDGESVEIKIPAGVQHDTKLRISGKGMPYLKSNLRADMYVKIKIEIPVNISLKEKELWGNLKLESKNREIGGFWTKMKDFLSRFSR